MFFLHTNTYTYMLTREHKGNERKNLKQEQIKSKENLNLFQEIF